MEGIKPVVKLKCEFEYREKSIIIAFFWNFEIIRILMQGTKTTIFFMEYFVTI